MVSGQGEKGGETIENQNERGNGQNSSKNQKVRGVTSQGQRVTECIKEKEKGGEKTKRSELAKRGGYPQAPPMLGEKLWKKQDFQEPRTE